jgi:chaperonin GroEL
MEFNNPSEIVKDLNFGNDARSKVLSGVDKLAAAVKSTLGASGMCVIYEDALGSPVITKDGVTVAESVVLLDPVENIGAKLVKQASAKTVAEAGDGTTTSIVLTEALLKNINETDSNKSIREIKDGIYSGLEKVNKFLENESIEVKDNLLEHVSSISCNNDKELGKIISEAYKEVGKNGIVMMEESESEKTYSEIVDGVQFEAGLTSPHFTTNKDKGVAELDNPAILIVNSNIPNLRKIQNVLEHVIKTRQSLLIIAQIDEKAKSALLMNKIKGNINVNIVDLPGFAGTRQGTLEDLSILTGAKVISEELGDDLDLIQPDVLGSALKSVTDNDKTVLTVDKNSDLVQERIKEVEKLLKNEKDGMQKKFLQQRLSMLSGSVGMIRVGAVSKVELKEKKDRVEDAIYATKAAIREGIVPGGGIALLNAAQELEKSDNIGEKILANSIKAPFTTIMNNAGIENYETPSKIGVGFDVISGNSVEMIKAGIVDPVLVTKTALKNAVSVAATIASADCIVSNIRINPYESR